jgi:uncharacterized integral membrane protein
VARIVISVVLIVALVILVLFNVTFTTTFSLFGVRFEAVPTVAVALLSFAAGVVYSLFLYLARTMHARRVKDVETRHKDLTRREKELDERTAAHEKATAEAAKAEGRGGTDQGAGGAQGSGREPGKRKSLRDRLKSIW